MKKVLLATVLVLALAGQGWASNAYVDSAAANDTADGLTSLTPKKLLTSGIAITTNPGDVLYLKKNSYWLISPASITVPAGVTVTTYGEGTKPYAICGATVATGDWLGPNASGCYYIAATTCLWLLEEQTAIRRGAGHTLSEGAGSWRLGKEVEFTSGGTYEIIVGNTVTGATSGKTGVVKAIYLSSWTWAGGDAAGTLYVDSTSGAFVSENLNVGANSDVATIGGDFTGRLYYKPTGGGAPSVACIRMQNVPWSVAATGVIFDGIKFVGRGLNANLSGSRDFTVQNCDFAQCFYGANVYLLTGHSGVVTISNNVFDYCGTNIYLNSQGTGYYFNGTVISGNTVTHSNMTVAGYDYNDIADKDGLTFQNLRNAVIENNNITGSSFSTAGIIEWYDQTALPGNIVRNNYIKDISNAAGIVWGAPSTSPTDNYVKIYNNIVTGCSIGIRLNSPQDSDNTSLIVNNTIYNCVWGINLNNSPDYYTVKNNIISSCTYPVYSSSIGVIGNNVFNYNLYSNRDT